MAINNYLYIDIQRYQTIVMYPNGNLENMYQVTRFMKSDPWLSNEVAILMWF